MQRQIAEGAIAVLATAGLAGVTHRAVAKEANVSLAATTRHYSGKMDILAEASRLLLSEYLESFETLKVRLQQGKADQLHTLDDLMFQVTVNALCRDRQRSLAWWEIMLSGGRSPIGQTLARTWFQKLNEVWLDIGQGFDTLPDERQIRLAIERVIGTIFLLHPLELDQGSIERLLGGADLKEFLKPQCLDQGELVNPKDKKEKMRAFLIETGAQILIEQGPGAMSYRSVAERAGMTRSGPSYYFESMNDLVEGAQLVLFSRAKERYETNFRNLTYPCDTPEELARLAAQIFRQEAKDFELENLAYFSTWIAAARSPDLRGFVERILYDRSLTSEERISEVSQIDASDRKAFAIHAVFVGKLVKALATGPDKFADLECDFLTALYIS